MTPVDPRVGDAAVQVLARAKDGEGVKSGPWGLAIILLLCIASYFLFKSMSRHLKKVREDFPADPAKSAAAQPAVPPAEPTVAESSSRDVPPADASKPPS